jgi:tetratricopeptide (TPR) repeat protein
MDEAETALREAVRIDPYAALSHLNLGKVIGANGKIADAIIEVGYALRLDPNIKEAHLVIEKLRALQGMR